MTEYETYVDKSAPSDDDTEGILTLKQAHLTSAAAWLTACANILIQSLLWKNKKAFNKQLKLMWINLTPMSYTLTTTCLQASILI